MGKHADTGKNGVMGLESLPLRQRRPAGNKPDIQTAPGPGNSRKGNTPLLPAAAFKLKWKKNME